MKTLPLGLIVAILTFAADQWHKWFMLERLGMEAQGRIELAPFFDLVMVWNRGISFGMFGRGGYGIWPLIALSAVIAGVLLAWLTRNPPRFTALALGLIIGGALGNVADRLRFGAVADFFSFHVGGYAWPAFNIADSAICIGVVFLAVESMIARKPSPTLPETPL